MRLFIGTKIVKASATIYDKVEPDGTSREGYKVVYADGYESWSPKEVFEKSYRPTDGMNFGLAIEALKLGKKICRTSWTGMFLLYVPGTVACIFT